MERGASTGVVKGLEPDVGEVALLIEAEGDSQGDYGRNRDRGRRRAQHLLDFDIAEGTVQMSVRAAIWAG